MKIRSMDDAVLASELLRLFCEKHQAAPGRCYQTALCLEEIAVNIIQHGFPRQKKNLPADVRVVYTGDGISIRIRDHCPRFNLQNYQKYLDAAQDDPVKNIGIRMTVSAAKNMQYVNLLNTNTFIMVI